MCKIMEDFAREQRETGRDEMREEMHIKMRKYGKKQKSTGRRQGRKELVSVVRLLRNGKDKEEIRHRGYGEATINDELMILE